jgi:microcystin-dependent protein
LSLHDLGEQGGSETVSLLESEMPSHQHAQNASTQQALENSPAGQLAASGDGVNLFAPAGSFVAMSPSALAPAGGDQPHNNLQPYLTFYFNIALQGVYPPRT